VNSFVRSVSVTALVLAFASVAFAACGDESSEPAGLCDPGENIFCRCPGGEAGTRTCVDGGDDFDECVVAPSVPCGDRVECEPYSTIPCLCPSGDQGIKECLREGTGYDECFIGIDQPCPDEPIGTGGMMNTGGMGAGAGPTGCAHDLCETGTKLSASCDSCASAVCAADDYCCNTNWDSLCVGLVDQECDNLCNPVVMCNLPLCMPSATEFMNPNCDPCVTSVCMADSVCCGQHATLPGAWDELCVGEVKDGVAHPACNSLCCAHSECSSGAKLDATCSDCATSVCAGDPYCCNNTWDSICVGKANADSKCNCN
jgi:hypothetical protein